MANFNIEWLISKRQFCSLTGIEVDTFRKLAECLRPHWQERWTGPAACCMKSRHLKNKQPNL